MIYNFNNLIIMIEKNNKIISKQLVTMAIAEKAKLKNVTPQKTILIEF